MTGNKNKVAEMADHVRTNLAHFTTLDIDLPEIQDSEVLNIVQEKCRRAFSEVNKLSKDEKGDDAGVVQSPKTVLIEDTCLHFSALNGMPGPYIKCKLCSNNANANFHSPHLTVFLFFRVLECGWSERLIQDARGL